MQPTAGRRSSADPRPARIAAALLATLLAGGCAAVDTTFDQPLALDQVEQLPVGTDYRAVLDAFGPPAGVSRAGSGMAFLYTYTTLTERQYGLFLPGALGKLFKAVYATVDADLQAMEFAFDGDGRLTGAAARAWTVDAGDGFSITLLFSVGSLTDTAHYEGSATETARWGHALLRPLPEVLNTPQNLETGTNGLELAGTTRDVGQQTLELRNE